MRLIFVSLMLVLGFAVQAEETICTVKGMHCKGCTEMVEGKVCDEAKYSTCTVKVTDEKKELGEVHLVTKEAKTKVDQKALKAMIKDAGYEMKTCKAPKKSKKA